MKTMNIYRVIYCWLTLINLNAFAVAVTVSQLSGQSLPLPMCPSAASYLSSLEKAALPSPINNPIIAVGVWDLCRKTLDSNSDCENKEWYCCTSLTCQWRKGLLLVREMQMLKLSCYNNSCLEWIASLQNIFLWQLVSLLWLVMFCQK